MPHLMPALPGPELWGPPAEGKIKKSVLAALIILLTLGLYLALSCLAYSTAQAAGFSDLQGHWAAPEIAKAVDTGYIKGYADGRFKPNAGVTRAEFVAMADSAFKIAAAGSPGAFRDVHSGDWFSNAVRAAVAAGFVNGYPDGTFHPQQVVNRQEASCMLAQILKLSQDGPLKFTDASQIDDWAKTYVDKLVAKGIINGYPEGTFRPKKAISRAEAVVLINQALAAQAVAVTPSAPGAPEEPSRGYPGALTVQVSHDQSGETVDIMGAQGGACQLADKTDPPGLVVTVPGVTVVRTPLEIPVGSGGLDKVSTSFSDASPGAATVEISFTGTAPLTYYTSPGTNGELTITVPPQLYKIEAAPVSDFLAINLWATGPLNYQQSIQTNPPQLVFDFASCSLDPGLRKWQQQVNDLGVGGLYLSEPQPETVRLAVDAGQEISFTADSSNGGQQLVLRLKKGDSPAKPGPGVNSGSQGSLAGKRIVLDPGHGGNDPGAIGPHGAQEKWANLAIASKVAEILRQQGADVIMTRDGDTNPDLYARPEVANNANADVFVSIHANWVSNHSIGGTGTYTYAPPDTALGQQRDARLHLASCLQEDLNTTIGLRDAGVFENRFAVLRLTNMPAALVEVAFISNAWEEHLLGDADFQQQAAAGIAHGIARFLTGG